MSTTFVVSSGDNTTGGLENLHQLCGALSRDGHDARMLYLPFDRGFDVPDPYRRYDVSPARLEDVTPGSTVILPEICGGLIDAFAGCTIYFWWLSVDNFFGFVPQRRIGSFQFGASYYARRQFKQMRRAGVRHLYQSEYARQFCSDRKLEPAEQLGDYLANEYIRAATRPSSPRENIVVYNPLKGKQRTDQILRALEESGRPMPAVVPIQGMSRNDVLDLLSRAKVYIDFGEHPGKDRIPREAAAAGACILTNRRGSAANDVDVCIPDEYKIDDTGTGFEKRVVSRIHALMDDFDRRTKDLDAYRSAIAREPESFLRDVKVAFAI